MGPKGTKGDSCVVNAGQPGPSGEKGDKGERGRLIVN